MGNVLLYTGVPERTESGKRLYNKDKEELIRNCDKSAFAGFFKVCTCCNGYIVSPDSIEIANSKVQGLFNV